ncbi:DNA-binding response regulator [Croceivirga lutea]|uniref:LytR/AlgR family response regulator transcription factor n=1 Tax=Croceivirga lutea TaxID=1775167 RepID=UPI0016396263|nr:LytTR family DNA-binding domain-containing protein [Croceivirga lutea]GGG46658.1 DNA-binding response regulator [Croceivirga lutea]
MVYSYVIIDSNASSILDLRTALSEYKNFTCSALLNDYGELQNSILKYLPDLVVVNIDDKDNNVFSLINDLYQFLDTLPKIIAVSKDESKAYNAIKAGFFDYWLVSSSDVEIRKTLLRFKRLVIKEQIPATLCLKSYKDYHYLDTNEILYLKADNNSTDFHMRDGRKISAFKTLKSFEEKLPQNFVRVHQSYIINSNHIARINYGKSICTLKNNQRGLPFSRTYREKIDELKELLSKNAISTLS